MACAIEDAGFEIRDQIMWIYGSGFPKGGNRDGKGTCLKPAHEPIVLARKPLIGSVLANEAEFGTGALNIDACRVEGGETLRAGSGAIPMRHDPAVPRVVPGERYHPDQRGTLSEFKRLPGNVPPNPYGRWPANVIHDGSDEVVSGFPVGKSTIGKPRGAASGAGWGMTATGAEYSDEGSAARFFYCAKATKADRDEGLDQFEPQAFVQFQTGNGESGAASSLSEGRETEYRNTHPTVKPEAVMRWLVRLITPAGGTVLDPFTGSGSTGKAAMLEARSFVGCELTDAYLPIARARIAAAESRAAEEAIPPAQHDLFAEIAA
jgi:site-specific DNA-methyltransferase (adenine-specific)